MLWQWNLLYISKLSTGVPGPCGVKKRYLLVNVYTTSLSKPVKNLFEKISGEFLPPSPFSKFSMCSNQRKKNHDPPFPKWVFDSERLQLQFSFSLQMFRWWRSRDERGGLHRSRQVDTEPGPSRNVAISVGNERVGVLQNHQARRLRLQGLHAALHGRRGVPGLLHQPGPGIDLPLLSRTVQHRQPPSHHPTALCQYCSYSDCVTVLRSFS